MSPGWRKCRAPPWWPWSDRRVRRAAGIADILAIDLALASVIVFALVWLIVVDLVELLG